MSKAGTNISAQCRVFWLNVDYLKQLNGMTDTDLARVMGRSPQTIYNRRYHPRNTTLADVCKVASHFEVTPASLLVPLTADSVPPMEDDE